MKTLNFFRVRVFFILAVLVGLLFFGGCGDSEDTPINPTSAFVSEFKWPPGATGELWELTDAEVAELLALNPPSDWYETEDSELRNKYYFAQLLKQFGDIPELRYIIVFDLKPKDNITLEQAIAWSEAMYRLFPSTENLKALRDIQAVPPDGYVLPQDEPKNEIEAWIKKDPEGVIETQRLLYVEKYGDIPEVHIYLNLLRKQLLGERLTEAERQEMNAALLHLQQLRAQDENKQDDDNDN
ncbi:hypothetical protein J5I95_09935 [Candidatus Poribacteria bacterium]|nr:hypothetical protein [Candidatus Poribacteria bacterium]